MYFADGAEMNEKLYTEIIQEGFDAYTNGIGVDLNPYSFNSMSWRRWNRGYSNAQFGDYIDKKEKNG